MDLKNAQKQTPLAIVNEIFAAGNFVCPVKEKVGAECETEIGQATDYEKAIVLANDRIFQEQKDLMASNQDKLESEDGPGEELNEQLYNQKVHHELLNNLFWASIRQRLTSVNSDYMAIRSDWKLVSIENKEGEKCQTCERADHCPIAVESVMADFISVMMG